MLTNPIIQVGCERYWQSPANDCLFVILVLGKGTMEGALRMKDGTCEILVRCDSIKPVAKLLLCALEPVEILDRLKKYHGSNIFGCLPIKKSMHAISEHSIVMPPIQPSKRFRFAVGLAY